MTQQCMDYLFGKYTQCLVVRVFS